MRATKGKGAGAPFCPGDMLAIKGSGSDRFSLRDGMPVFSAVAPGIAKLDRLAHRARIGSVVLVAHVTLHSQETGLWLVGLVTPSGYGLAWGANLAQHAERVKT